MTAQGRIIRTVSTWAEVIDDLLSDDPARRAMAVARLDDDNRKVEDHLTPNKIHTIGPAATDTAPFENGWANYALGTQPAGFYRIGMMVHPRGHIKNGTITAAAFHLPPGFRPAFDLTFSSVDGAGTGAIGRVNILADGSVIPFAGNNAFYSLNVPPFLADGA